MQATRQTGRASGAQHAKEKVGRGGGAHREWCRVEGRGDGERLWVSAWCLWYRMEYVSRSPNKFGRMG